MEKIKINICGVGDPGNPSVWSGTPWNILNELKKTGHAGLHFSIERNDLPERILKYIEKTYFGIPIAWERRGLFVRGYRAMYAAKQTRRSETNSTLHFGTAGLPFFNVPKLQRHYLFIDSTWNLWSTQSSLKKDYSNRLQSASEKLERSAFRQVDHIFSVSEYVKENLIAHYNIESGKITVVGTGTGIIQPYFGEKDSSRAKILFVAKDRFEDKGGNILIEAFEELLLRRPDAQLTMVGQKIYQKIKHPNIKCFGRVSKEKLQELFNTHTIYAMPSVNEPWGLVYIEAMLCRMPIVGINKNSFPEISDFGKCGVSIERANSKQLCDAMYKLLSDHAVIKEMGNYAQSYAMQKYTWENTVGKIIEKIQSLNAGE